MTSRHGELHNYYHTDVQTSISVFRPKCSFHVSYLVIPVHVYNENCLVVNFTVMCSGKKKKETSARESTHLVISTYFKSGRSSSIENSTQPAMNTVVRSEQPNNPSVNMRDVPYLLVQHSLNSNIGVCWCGNEYVGRNFVLMTAKTSKVLVPYKRYPTARIC